VDYPVELFMKCRESSIFILDILGTPSFAFEAKDLVQAETFVHAPWFATSLSAFFASKRKEWDKHVPLRTRVATAEEASIYRNIADEFSDASGSLFIAHISDLKSAR
jgi:hypothetical protein